MPVKLRCHDCGFAARFNRFTPKDRHEARCPERNGGCGRVGTLRVDNELDRETVQGHPVRYINLGGSS